MHQLNTKRQINKLTSLLEICFLTYIRQTTCSMNQCTKLTVLLALQIYTFQLILYSFRSSETTNRVIVLICAAFQSFRCITLLFRCIFKTNIDVNKSRYFHFLTRTTKNYAWANVIELIKRCTCILQTAIFMPDSVFETQKRK